MHFLIAKTFILSTRVGFSPGIRIADANVHNRFKLSHTPLTAKTHNLHECLFLILPEMKNVEHIQVDGCSPTVLCLLFRPH